MLQIHIANTFFEWELEQSLQKNGSSQPLHSTFHKNPVYLQLQFLPLLYADKEDLILVSDLPDQKGFPFQTLSSFKCAEKSQLHSWGHSHLIAKWAHPFSQMTYITPAWDVTQTINSKLFSFQNSTPLAQAELLYQNEDAKRWLKETQGLPRVFKTLFGVSGQGHFHIDANVFSIDPKISSYLDKQWQKQLPIIAEPWVERVLDFSSQWIIHPDQQIEWVGATLCKNDHAGKYLATQIGDETFLFREYFSFFEEHKKTAFEVLKKIAKLGYFGNIGIDAMIYKDPLEEKIRLQPIVEINARKTMGWVALHFWKKHHLDYPIEFRYGLAKEGLLPSYLQLANGKSIVFHRNIQIQKIPS